MKLPQNDLTSLAERGVKYSVSVEGNMTCVVLHEFSLPSGYDQQRADLLVRLNPGYPDVQPDMWWFTPAIRLVDGRSVQATDVVESHLGQTWQRWSRHFVPGQWRSGTDSLESYLALIRKELERCAQSPN